MPHTTRLLFLHGVGDEQDDAWRESLEASLTRLGYPGLTGIDIIAPKYPDDLKGAGGSAPIPPITVQPLDSEDARLARRSFQRRRTKLELLLGRDDRGPGVPLGDQAAPLVAKRKQFIQAQNYIDNPGIRGWVLQLILKELPEVGRLLIVGHSLGSVIAADLVRRLPTDLEVAGVVTIGSPLAHRALHADGLRDLLREPPANVQWWVNLWSRADLVPIGRGPSRHFPWILDQRIPVGSGWHDLVHNHAATTYFESDKVATAIAFGLFGTQVDEVVMTERDAGAPPDESEALVLLALRFAHLLRDTLEGERRDRYTDAIRQVQATLAETLIERREDNGEPVPRSITALRIDLADLNSLFVKPDVPTDLDIEDACRYLTAIAATNVIQPFEIEIPQHCRVSAMEQLTLDIGLGSRVGSDVYEAMDRASDALRGPNWTKWTALAIGAALIGATGGLALAAAPGVAGAAAITSGLAAFGPGGMIGGLLTTGTLVSVGSGSIAVGLASAATSAEAVEAVVAGQLMMAIVRELQKIPQDANTWVGLKQAEYQVSKELGRLDAVSDDTATTVKDLRRKLDVTRRALHYLHEHHLVPATEKLQVMDVGAEAGLARDLGHGSL